MKRLFLLSIFAVLLFITSFPVLAVDSGSASAQPTPSVDYVLPYPGLLPDSPLYWLKNARDLIVGFLISDPLKKADFDLLQSDKRLQASVYLLKKDAHKNKQVLATLEASEDYFQESVAKVSQAQQQGLRTNDLADRLAVAAAKHSEILNSLQNKFSGQDQKELGTLEKNMHELAKEVRDIRAKNK